MVLRASLEERFGVSGPVYLDYNSTTPVDERVFKEMAPFFTKIFGNSASSGHSFGWDAQEAVEDARAEVAALVNVHPSEIVFTSGATESVNLAIKGVARHGDARDKHVVTTVIEHPAVLQSCRRLSEQGCRITYLAVVRLGHVNLDELKGVVDGDTALVALASANSELGTLYPIAEYAAVARAHGALYLTDATQSLGKVSLDLKSSAVDLAAFSAHKLYAPKGVGALYVAERERHGALVPQLDGGGQERGLRSGTVNVSGIVGFGHACRLARTELAGEAEKCARQRDRLERELVANVDFVTVNGDVGNRLPNTTSLTFDGIDARALVRDLHPIAVSTRSACTSRADGPSHVLQGIGLSDEQTYSTVRFSLGRYTTDREVDYTVARVIESVRRFRQK